MHRHLWLTAAAFAIGVALLATPSAAQQKTVKACQQEWRAARAANQAAGMTEKAYVEKCRSGAAAASPAPATPKAQPAAAPSNAAKPAKTVKTVKTVKACEDEWRANKAGNQAAGITEKAYVEKCRATATAAPPPAPTAAPMAPSRGPSQPTSATPAPAPTQSRTPTAGQPAGANQYVTEAQASARCAGGTVVWVNLDSKIYHYSTSRNYGHTKSGAYMCERDTAAAGFRAAKNEKHP
jgi:hypothetical protein